MLPVLEKYDADQPRHPKGDSRGGQWSSPVPQGQPDVPVEDAQRAFEEDFEARGIDEDRVLQDLNTRQEEFLAKNPESGGIRVDADLDAEPWPTEDLKAYLGGFPFTPSMESFVAEQGEAFVVPDIVPDIALETPKMCFSNCAEKTVMAFGLDKDKYDYVEGFVADAKLPFPVHHAWLAEKGTNIVVDPTLGWRPAAAYYGVRIPNKYHRRKLVENGYYGLFTNGAMLNDIVLGTDEDFEYKP